jgi:hypothetical protein
MLANDLMRSRDDPRHWTTPPSNDATDRRTHGQRLLSELARARGLTMTNYVLVYSGGGMPQTEAEQQAVMAAWGAWYEGLGQAVVDGGNPFGLSTSVGADGTVSQGAPSALSGYTVISSNSLDAATEHAKSCPILADGGRVDIYETFQIM